MIKNGSSFVYCNPWRRLFSNSRRYEAMAGYLFIFIPLLGYVIFYFIPTLYLFILSFMDYSIGTTPTFVGLDNFKRMFSDLRMYTVYKNTFILAFFATMGNTGIGLLIAVALKDRFSNWVRVLLRSAYFFPSLTGLIFVSIIWQFFYHKDVGIINYYLGILGLGKIGWLNSKGWVLVSIIILDVWKNVGVSMLIFLGGLYNIPKYYYEAAAVDGATPLRRFFNITLPLLSPTIFFVTIYNLTGALRMYESILVLTRGGPGDFSRSIVMYIYEKAFQSYDFGYASSLSVLFLLVVIVITLLFFATSKKWVYYHD